MSHRAINPGVNNASGQSPRQNQKHAMKNFILATILGAAVSVLAGCESNGLSNREHSGVDYANYVLSLPVNQPDAMSKKTTLPIRLAVAQIGEPAPPSSMLASLAARPDLVTLAIGLPLPGEKQAGGYEGRVQSLCKLAKASGADYVFLFGGNEDSWSEGNFLRIFDFTVIGAVLIPATEIVLEGKGAGVLIDASTREPVFLVNVETKGSKYSPDWFADDRTVGLSAQCRDQLVRKLQEGLLKKLSDHPAP